MWSSTRNRLAWTSQDRTNGQRWTSGCGTPDCGRRASASRSADLLFAKGDRHLSAEELHEEALAAGVPVSLATVYNALHQFTEAGLLRILAVEGSKTYFDTNTSDHHHFFIEGENRIFDIAAGPVRDHQPAGAARKAWRSPMSTSWCACAPSAAERHVRPNS